MGLGWAGEPLQWRKGEGRRDGHGDTPICRFGSEFRACGSHCAEAESWDPVPLALPCSLVPFVPGPMSAPLLRASRESVSWGPGSSKDACVCVCVLAHACKLGEAEKESHCRGLEKKARKPRKRNSSQAHEAQGLRWSQFPLQGAFSS